MWFGILSFCMSNLRPDFRDWQDFVWPRRRLDGREAGAPIMRLRPQPPNYDRKTAAKEFSFGGLDSAAGKN
jgi:hypothetical protein